MSYCEHQEVAARVMVKVVKTEKKTLLKSMGVQVLILNKMVNLMLVNQRPIGTPDSKFETSNYAILKPREVNSKSEGPPMSTPTSKSDGTPINTPRSKSDCTLMGTHDSKMRVAHQEQSTTNSELHTKMSVARQNEGAIHYKWYTEIKLAR